MKIRDHSLKARRAYSVIEIRARQDAVRTAIVRAGFPIEAADRLQAEIIEFARFYRGEVDTAETRPRLREVRASLNAVLATGKMFRKALNYLSNQTRVEIMDADQLRHPDQTEADSSLLADDVGHLLNCAHVVLLNTPLDRGARRQETAHINFAFHLAIIWRAYFPNSGVTKHGVDGTFRGPLVDFAEKILKLEGAAYRNRAAFRSRLALAKSLHKHRARAAEIAANRVAARAERSSTAATEGQ
jgi:hypothetical protein